jgi:trehalose 6-phosphate phosphatase
MLNLAGLPRPPALPDLMAASEIALFLDFDGTLVELAETPQGVTVPPYLSAGLQSLSQSLQGRLAIITGRPLDALDGFLGPHSIAAVGSHGGEYRGAPPPPPPLSPASLASIENFRRKYPDLIVEPKPFGIALHYRQQPEAASSVYQLLEKIAEDENLAVKPGKMLVEIGPSKDHKGAAVRTLMSQMPFRGARPIFIGDDVTDEDGFHAVKAAGGYGILVGPNRATAADFHLHAPGDVLRWCQINGT